MADLHVEVQKSNLKWPGRTAGSGQPPGLSALKFVTAKYSLMQETYRELTIGVLRSQKHCSKQENKQD